jgi:hypothetical protein
MDSSKKLPLKGRREHGPDVVGALRDWVGQDHRIASTGESNDDQGGTSLSREGTPKDVDAARTSQDPFDVETTLPSASGTYDFHVAPSIQGLDDSDPGQPKFEGDVSAGGANEYSATGLDQNEAPAHPCAPEPRFEARQSVARRVARTLTQGFVTVAVVGAIVAFLSNDKLGLTGSSTQTVRPETAAPGLATNPLNPVLQQQQLAVREQLDRVANDLASVQRSVERLSARQDEMAQNIATLRASEQNLRQELTTLGQAIGNSRAVSRRHRHSNEKRF